MGRCGRLALALAWIGVAGGVVWKMPLAVQGYGAFVRGWALAMGAAFGLVCLATHSRPFLGRALSAVGLAGAITILGLAGRSDTTGGTFDGARRMLGAEYGRRVEASLAVWQERTESEVWRTFSTRMPDAAERAERMAGTLAAVTEDGESGPSGSLIVLAPALLGLESLMALSLGWAAYHRLSRVRIGPPLGALRDLRFNDQLVWGLVVGTACSLPHPREWRGRGAKWSAFRHAVRLLGAGVLMWWIPTAPGGDCWCW